MGFFRPRGLSIAAVVFLVLGLVLAGAMVGLRFGVLLAAGLWRGRVVVGALYGCLATLLHMSGLLYTSDAADEADRVYTSAPL